MVRKTEETPAAAGGSEGRRGRGQLHVVGRCGRKVTGQRLVVLVIFRICDEGGGSG